MNVICRISGHQWRADACKRWRCGWRRTRTWVEADWDSIASIVATTDAISTDATSGTGLSAGGFYQETEIPPSEATR